MILYKKNAFSKLGLVGKNHLYYLIVLELDILYSSSVMCWIIRSNLEVFEPFHLSDVLWLGNWIKGAILSMLRDVLKSITGPFFLLDVGFKFNKLVDKKTGFSTLHYGFFFRKMFYNLADNPKMVKLKLCFCIALLKLYSVLGILLGR